jgi:hypothetical protein
MKTSRSRQTRKPACAWLFLAAISQAGCSQLKDRFDLFAPVSPEMERAKMSKDGTYRDEYGLTHSYKDAAGSDRPLSDYLTPTIPLGGSK